MARMKRGVVARRRHKKILKAAKGYYGARSRVLRVAKQAVTRAGQYAYRDRRQRKRQFRHQNRLDEDEAGELAQYPQNSPQTCATKHLHYVIWAY